jgi:hypothetical protein
MDTELAEAFAEILDQYSDHLELAWGVIANAGVPLGDWNSMTPEWRDAARKWEVKWLELVKG